MEHAYDGEVLGGHRLEHALGDRVHIVADPLGLSLLARLCHPDTKQPRIQQLTEACFRHLLGAVVEQLPTRVAQVPTRMLELEPNGVFQGRILDPNARVVLVDVARGGMIPSYVFQMELLGVLESEALRVDHIFMQRVTDPETGHVSGVDNSGSKIGGDVEGVTLIVPDPMAATGSSMSEVLRLYRDEVDGTPRKVVVCHLIVTPEYVRKITSEHPEVEIYALRYDRGLSTDDALAQLPGTASERGLTDHDYIVPGAGGVGELLNNTPE